jgi:glutathione S-transferase
MNTGKYTLYGRPGAGSVAPQILLEEIGAPYQRVWIERDAAAVAAYKKTNPTGKVPALALPEGPVIFESAAICIHLATAHSDAKLAPRAGTPGHARFLQWMVYMSANLYDSALRAYYPARYTTGGEREAQQVKAQATSEFVGHLQFISESLAPYVMGETLSAADSYLYMLASWYEGDLKELRASLPKLAAHAGLMAQRPATRKVEADNAT